MEPGKDALLFGIALVLAFISVAFAAGPGLGPQAIALLFALASLGVAAAGILGRR